MFLCQCKMSAWTKNTDMAKSANALSAARRSNRETGSQQQCCSNAAVVSPNKESDTPIALSRERIPAVSPRLRNMLPRMRNSSSSIAQEAPIQWSKYGTGLAVFCTLSVARCLRNKTDKNGVASQVFRRGTGRILSRISARMSWGNYGREATMEHRPPRPILVVSDNYDVCGKSMRWRTTVQWQLGRTVQKEKKQIGRPVNYSDSNSPLFAGAGGGILADLLLGPSQSAQSKSMNIASWSYQRQKTLSSWFPIFTDVPQFDGAHWCWHVDVIAPASMPGHQPALALRGGDGERSNL